MVVIVIVRMFMTVTVVMVIVGLSVMFLLVMFCGFSEFTADFYVDFS